MIREMKKQDWQEVSDIYVQGIEKGISTFSTRCPSYEVWDEDHIDKCRLVYIENGKVVGWAAISPSSSRCAYKGCVELSVYVDSDCQGKGIGTSLVRKMIEGVEKEGYWSIGASILEVNAASVAMAKKCGFREIGYRERVAKDRFGNWQNVILIELRLDSRKEKATTYFENGFNCSQAVFTTFATEYGISEELALKIATQFGGGARKGELCGAVAGALMVLGLEFGHFDMSATEEKAKAYAKAEEFMNRFIERNGTVVCRELLGYDVTRPEDMRKLKELGVFQNVCPKMITCATEILEQML